MPDPLDVVERLLLVRMAEANLIPFTLATMLDPRDPRKSAYVVAKHHRYVASIYEQVEAGAETFVILNAPPSHGKSEIGSRRLPCWFVGRNPGKHVMLGAYSETKAKDFRSECLGILESEEYLQIFPDAVVARKEADRLMLANGSILYFVGRGSAATGRHADLILIDDPLKDDKEAQSPLIRENLWKWWTTTISTRRRTDKAPVIVTQTRWTEDDLTGRLTDPGNPHYSKRQAERIRVINLPAFAEDNDALGRAPGEPLWPERFGRDYLEIKQEEDPVSFAALYQGRPAPEDGIFYTREILEPNEYDRGDFPEDQDLRYYGCSDHAVSTSRMNDFTCLMSFAVDKEGTAWILPDIKWERMQSDRAVEHMIAAIKANKPLAWFTAQGTIDRTLGPFLRRRMQEEGAYVALHGIAETVDKLQRAHSARARTAQRKVKFPRYAPWWPKAKEQLMKFPNGTHADFVDTLSLLGMALDTIITGHERARPKKVAQWGTMRWLRESTQGDRVPNVRGGW